MIHELQQYLKDTLQGCTDIPAGVIYTELKDKQAYRITPFASILPDPAQIEPAWNNEQAYPAQDGRYIKVLRKYRISQPWTLHIGRRTLAECTRDAEAFLTALHHKAVLEGTVAEITPNSVEILLASGEMDHYEARLSIITEYGLYTQKAVDKIQTIKIEVNKNVE